MLAKFTYLDLYNKFPRGLVLGEKSGSADSVGIALGYHPQAITLTYPAQAPQSDGRFYIPGDTMYGHDVGVSADFGILRALGLPLQSDRLTLSTGVRVAHYAASPIVAIMPPSGSNLLFARVSWDEHTGPLDSQRLAEFEQEYHPLWTGTISSLLPSAPEGASAPDDSSAEVKLFEPTSHHSRRGEIAWLLPRTTLTENLFLFLWEQCYSDPHYDLAFPSEFSAPVPH